MVDFKKATTYSKLRREIETSINKNSCENASDTPDWILAEYLISCLHAFDMAVLKRRTWYGEKNEKK